MAEGKRKKGDEPQRRRGTEGGREGKRKIEKVREGFWTLNTVP